MARRLVAAVAFACSACWVPLEKGAQLDAEIRDLQDKQRDNAEAIQRQGAAQEQRIADALARLEELSEKVSRDSAVLQAKLDELNRTASRTGANLGADMEKALGEISSLRGALEERAHEIQAIKQSLDGWRVPTEARLAKLEEKPPPPPPPPPEPTKQELYEEALKKLEAGETGAARAKFLAFRDKFKGDALAGNAQYWLAETYYAEGRYREAIVEFQRVQDEFKTSEKAPDAMLKLGFSFVALGLKDDGMLFLEELQKKHPKSAAAERARAKLKELAKAGKKKG